MSDIYGPFDGTPWAQDQWYRYAAAWVPSGLIDVPAASVSAGGFGITFSGLTPTLAVGRSWVRGAGYEISGAAKTLSAVPANTNATLSRRDRIVLRRDLAAKTVAPVLIQGTPASSPAAPALTQVETGQWDSPLFSFLVPPNSSTSITGIVDERAWLDPGRQSLAFASTAARDANFPTVPDGAYCYTEDAGGWRGAGGVWKADKVTGLLTLASGWGAYGAYPLPGYHLAADGRVTCHGMMGRSGGNIVVNSAGLLIGSLPAAIRPPDDMQPRIYMGTGSPVQRISATLYVDHTSAGLMTLFPFDGGSYTLVGGSSGFVCFDGLSWYI